jgi:hypothetical protein
MPWWADVLGEQEQAPALPQQRPVWTAEARESHRLLFTAGRPASFYPLSTFYGRLGEKLELAKRLGEPLAVVVLQLPSRSAQQWTRQRQRDLENVLRLSVRRGDLPARLSPTTLAVALPHTGASAGVVALRLQRVLSRLAEGRVGSGTACHPADGRTARELLQVATWRSLTAMPGAQPDPELAQLLGPLRPTRTEGLSSYR